MNENLFYEKANIKDKLRELLSEHSSHKLISLEFNNNKVEWGKENIFFNIYVRKRDRNKETYIFRQSCLSSVKSNNFSLYLLSFFIFFFLRVSIPFFQKEKEENISDIPITICLKRVKGMEEKGKKY